MKKLVLSLFCVGFAVAASAQTSTTTPKKTAEIKKLNKPLVVRKSAVTVSPTSPKSANEQAKKKQPVTRKESAIIEEKNEKK
jgi:hypothetical protein